MARLGVLSLGNLGQTVQPPAGGVAPGSPCYDSTHDGGEIHCASVANVLLSAINPFAQSMTTTCSDAEEACLQTAAPATLNNPTGTPTIADACTAALGVSCTSLAMFGVLGIVGLLFLTRK